MASDDIIPYIKFNPKLGTYNTIEVQSFPFPPYHMSEVCNLRTFLIERNKHGYFLRSALNSLFCYALYEVVKEIEVPNWDRETANYKYDDNGEVILKNEKLSYLCFTVDGKERVVAYNYAGSGKSFLRVDASDEPFESLDERLQKLYLGAKLVSGSFMAHYEDEIRKLDAKKTSIEPKGEWEAQLFRDVFKSDPNRMSDDEYEMIFGVER